MSEEGMPPVRFPAGARQTQIPSLFFGEIIAGIEDPVELLVSVYAFYLLGRKPPAARWFVEDELRAEPPLRSALARLDREGLAALGRGLDAAVVSGTLLRAVANRDGRLLRLYAANVPGAVEALTRVGGALALPREVESDEPGAPLPNIFLLYEENIGVVSPLLAEQLAQAEAEYPWPWIVAAFREAVALNRRSWRYIERILERWRSEGPDLEAIRRSVSGDERRSLAGRYWRHVRR